MIILGIFIFLGLGLIYDLVKAEEKEVMVSVLVDRLMSGKRTKQVVEDSTELFKPGSLGTDPDGYAYEHCYKTIFQKSNKINY